MPLTLRTWEVRLGIVLVASSAAIYTAKYLLLGDPENTYTYIFNALGFLPINVLLVTLILNQLLSIRAKRERLEKLNMVIGTFFSEAGTWLLAFISDRDSELPELREGLIVTEAWTPETFAGVCDRLQHRHARIAVDAADRRISAATFKGGGTSSSGCSRTLLSWSTSPSPISSGRSST